jgi:glutamyl-tRNA reductase
LSVVVVGIEHEKAPLDLLERVTVTEADMAKVMSALRSRMNLTECVLVSTCLRTEVYAVVERFHDAVFEVQDLLATKAGIDVPELEPYLSIRFDDDVAFHLFSVAAGLESAVLGESEVLGQVRRAWERARDERLSGPVLGALFRHAVETGKRVRSETSIARGTTSFSHAAVQLVESRLPHGLASTNVAVLGAGDLAAGILQALENTPAERRPATVVLVNRTLERAESLVKDRTQVLDIEALPLSDLSRALSEADVVFSAIETDLPVVGVETLGRGDDETRPLVIVDLGIPRSVEAQVRNAPGVTLLDMDDLRSSVASALDDRRAEAVQARGIVTDEVARYRDASRARGAAPVIAALRARLEDARVAELERRRSHFDGSDADWAQIDEASRAALAKVLHEPTVVLKETAGTARGERLVEALRTLFDL